MAQLRSGYTTGTCAAIAAKAAARMLLTQKAVKTEYVITPNGIRIEAEILSAECSGNTAKCAVRKFAGDDPDITDGMLIFAEVTLGGCGIRIDGGEGVGRVTKPGLDQPVGAAAINSVPRKMIADAVSGVIEELGAECGARVVISAPGGEEIANKTFNPRLGIEGGISILGTSGIVEPMSTRAVIDTIKVELNFKRQNGHDYAILVPGNYGRDFVRDSLGLDIDSAVKCANFIGQAIDLAIEKKFSGIVLIGHVGKLVKLAAGVMNTHSRTADARAEIFCTHAALCGAPLSALERIMECATTDDMTAVIKEYGIFDEVMRRIGERIDFYINKRCGGEIKYAFEVFSNVHGQMCRGGDEEVFKNAVKEYVK
ncbi:MAG: cobalt-precorrin-5B (C(1))-methyltransferase CbiD [Candidatus Ornithomonoglobus sp.]